MTYITNIINIVKLTLKLRKKTNKTFLYNFFSVYMKMPNKYYQNENNS